MDTIQETKSIEKTEDIKRCTVCKIIYGKYREPKKAHYMHIIDGKPIFLCDEHESIFQLIGVEKFKENFFIR
jgi:predicted ribosome-associated RNA-binding protein Tma20